MSLRKRMMALTILLIIPFAVLTFALLFSLNRISESYDAVVENITKVNEHNLVFKENIDSVLYMMVAHSLTKYGVGPELGLENPETLIRDAEETFEEVRATTVSPEALESIKRATKLLITLHKRVNDISSTVKLTGYYDENMESLDNDIYVLTEMIQERISEYIYYESVSMEQIRRQIDEQRIHITRFTLLAAGVLIFLAFVLSTYLTRTVTKPMQRLMLAAEQIGAGNFNAKVTPAGTPEIRTLGRSFNSMATRLGELVERNRQEQIHLRDLELKLLQAQIDPHFLYNTLDNIVWLAEDDRKEDVENIAAALSTFFRTALSGGRDEIRIREEEMHIRSYLEIQQFRYRDMLSYSIDVDPDCEDCTILKMTLQPVVENAIYHGIKNKRGGGHISIQIQGFEGRVRILISDTGMGMTKEQLTQLIRRVDGNEKQDGDHTHFGLSNVAERLRLNYGESSGLVFHSVYGEGTQVEILIPRIEAVN